MTQPITIISMALKQIGALASGETPEASDANDALQMLNWMLQQWSNQKMMIYCVQEVIHELTPGQFVYNIGPGGMVGATFTGSVSGNVLTVTALSQGALSVGQKFTANSTVFTITALGSATGGNGLGAIGTYFVDKAATVTSSTLYTNAPRPLRINSAFVRVVNAISGTLDYPVAILSSEEYELIGIKTLPGPWPRALYYQPTEPVGMLNYWPNPSQGEMHLYCDTVLTNFTSLTDTITLPEGYEMALMWNLAELLMPSYGKSDQQQVEMVLGNAKSSKASIKRTNMQPQQASRFDSSLSPARVKDAGFILHGGFI